MMANEIVNLNGTPKLAKGSVFQYFFGSGLIFQADPATDSYTQVGPNVSTLHPVAFADITDKLGHPTSKSIWIKLLSKG